MQRKRPPNAATSYSRPFDNESTRPAGTAEHLAEQKAGIIPRVSLAFDSLESALHRISVSVKQRETSGSFYKHCSYAAPDAFCAKPKGSHFIDQIKLSGEAPNAPLTTTARTGNVYLDRREQKPTDGLSTFHSVEAENKKRTERAPFRQEETHPASPPPINKERY